MLSCKEALCHAKAHITREMIVDAVFAAVRTAGARILWKRLPRGVAAACP